MSEIQAYLPGLRKESVLQIKAAFLEALEALEASWRATMLLWDKAQM